MKKAQRFNGVAAQPGEGTLCFRQFWKRTNERRTNECWIQNWYKVL